MKIILFQEGRPGEAYSVAEDGPEGALEELLEGEVEMVPLNHKLVLAVCARAEEERRPIWYAVHRLGREAAPVFGDCAVVRVRPDGSARDATGNDLEAAREIVRPVTA